MAVFVIAALGVIVNETCNVHRHFGQNRHLKICHGYFKKLKVIFVGNFECHMFGIKRLTTLVKTN